MDFDSIVPMLGLQLPKIYAVMFGTELLQEELKFRGMWEAVAGYSMLLPFVVAMAFSVVGEASLGDALTSGLVYGFAAMAMHEVHGGGA